MTPTDAVKLWGADVVSAALADAGETMTPTLAREIGDAARAALDDRTFALWALSLPWPRFVAVVRLTAGATRRNLMEH